MRVLQEVARHAAVYRMQGTDGSDGLRKTSDNGCTQRTSRFHPPVSEPNARLRLEFWRSNRDLYDR